MPGAMFARLVLSSLAFTLLVSGCSAEYYARRQARREQRLALREQRQQQRLAEQQQRNYARCSNPQTAYERGHNDGLQRHNMDTGWVAECPPEFQQQQYQAYNDGYQQGIQYAGQQVVVAGPAVGGQVYVSGGATPMVTSCRFSSDCGHSMHCRNWGGMGQVCMGYGGSGAPCWFGSDCVSGWCDGGTGSARTCR